MFQMTRKCLYSNLKAMRKCQTQLTDLKGLDAPPRPHVMSTTWQILCRAGQLRLSNTETGGKKKSTVNKEQTCFFYTSSHSCFSPRLTNKNCWKWSRKPWVHCLGFHFNPSLKQTSCSPPRRQTERWWSFQRSFKPFVSSQIWRTRQRSSLPQALDLDIS